MISPIDHAANRLIVTLIAMVALVGCACGSWMAFAVLMFCCIECASARALEIWEDQVRAGR